jgi:hypothetical protein
MALCAAAIWDASRTPAVELSGAPAVVFSAERAMAHVRAIAARPHPSGATEHARVREYVIGALRGLGIETQVQDTTGLGTHNAVAAHIFNVVARLPGESSGGPAVLLVAHYDGVPAGPAAGDDGAGVATLLETVRALRSRPALRHDVIALFSDGEEGGLTGAAAFVRDHPWAHDAAMILNFDARGTRGPALMFETGAGNLDAVRALRAVPAANATSVASTIYHLLPNDTDLSELLLLNQPSMNFAFADGVDRYHTSEDDVAHLDPGSVQHFGAYALSLATTFGNGELPRPRTGDAVFFTVPVFGLVLYPEGAALPSAALALVLALVVCSLVRRHDPRWLRGAILGVVGIVLSTAIGGGLAFGLVRLLSRSAERVQFGRPAGLTAAAIALAAVAGASACWTIARKFASGAGAHAGALIAAASAAFVVTARLPGASYLFVWPTAAAAASALISMWTADVRIVSAARWIAAAAIAFVVVPIVYMIAIVVLGIDVPGAIVLGVFVPFSLWLAAPQLEALMGLRRSIAWLAGAAALCVLAVLAARSQASPVPSMLGYAVDADTSRAWIVTPAQLARTGSWTAETLGPLAIRAENPGAAAAPLPDWLTRAIAGDAPTLAVPAATVHVAPPEIKLLADSSAGTERHVDLLVQPAPGTYSIRLRAVDTPVLSSSIEGRAIDPSRYRVRSSEWTIGYVAPRESGFTLRFIVRRQQPVTLDVIARSSGLPPIPNLPIAPRPPGVLLIHGGDLTAVHRRLVF